MSNFLKSRLSSELQLHGFSLYGLEIFGKKRKVCRVTIDHLDGISLDDCARLTPIIDALIEEGEYFSEAYTIEVSSPGIYRELRGEEDYARFTGRRVRVDSVNDTMKTRSVGILSSFDAEQVYLLADSGEELACTRAEIVGVHLSPKF